MKIRSLLVIALLLLQFFMVRAVSYNDQTATEQERSAIQNIPVSIGTWKGTDHSLSPEIYDILETRSIIHRSYVNNEGNTIFLSIVYYAETKVDFHAPEGCLGGKGIRITKSPVDLLLTKEDGNTYSLSANKLIQQEGSQGSTDLVYYFYKSGPFAGRSYIRLRMNLILNKFRDARKSGSLIRISTGIETDGDTENEGPAFVIDFLNHLQPYIIKYL